MFSFERKNATVSSFPHSSVISARFACRTAMDSCSLSVKLTLLGETCRKVATTTIGSSFCFNSSAVN